jgi:hypothetical protein
MPPWSQKQRKLAQAVKHGFKPTGAAKGFSKSFADMVVTESDDQGNRKITRTKKGK